MSTRLRHHDRFVAVVQLAVLLLVVGAVAGFAACQANRPADGARLALPIAELRSDAAELELIVEDADSDKLNPRFVREHARQLLKDQTRSRQELAKLRPWPELEATQRAALATAGEMHFPLGDLSLIGTLTERPDLEAFRARLREQEQSLRN